MIDWLIRRVERVIYNPMPKDGALFERFLRGLSYAYAAGVHLNGRRFDVGRQPARRLPCAVISIGNISVGGSGKTPLTMMIAQWAVQAGWRPLILSRGYGGSASKTGAIVSDGQHIMSDVTACGDEPLMMARRLKDIAVVVGRDRYQAGMMAIARFSPDLIVLDDGFQHRRLHRDIDLVLMDGQFPLGNGCLLPRGPLREPIAALRRADAVVFTRCDNLRPLPPLLQSVLGDMPLFYAAHQTYLAADIPARGFLSQLHAAADRKTDLTGRRVVVFSAIAGNLRFQQSVAGQGADVIKAFAFPDHHRFSRQELYRIEECAETLAADMLVTTEKDAMRIAPDFQWPRPLVVLGVRTKFLPDETAFSAFLRQRLDRMKQRTNLP